MAVNLSHPKTRVIEESSASYANTTKIRYTWQVHNFELRSTEIGHAIKSPTFPKSLKDEYNWQLSVYPNGVNENVAGYLSLELNFVPGTKSEVAAGCDFEILAIEEELFSFRHHWNVRKINELSEPFCVSDFIPRSILLKPNLELVSNDVLTIHCDIIIDEDIPNIVNKNYSQASQIMDHHGLSNNLNDLFESPKFCDIKLIINGVEIEAHKAILAARSPVFAAMFDSEMKEQQENRVDIIDVNYDVLKEMLRFMYTGRTTNLEKMADGLLMAADKYELEMLKSQCEHTLLKTIEVENAVSLLVLGDLHNAIRLKTEALDFICTHMKAVMKTAGYKSLYLTHLHLNDEIVKALASKITVSEI